ncbi:Formyltransferase [Apiospora phragmitis]|uniref:methionyl-tRNA formyltransferase n=1 Tax=Apiospora phragmitis TaxID=2905665 RepID=A0ABR1VE61_9PEZI
MMRRPLVVVSSALPRTATAWQAPMVATASCRMWWHYCYRQRGFSTTSRTLQQQQKRKKQSDALRILFCGSDEFSSASLRALHEEKERNPALIESIDVVVRPGKRVGRGLKLIQHPPIRDVAEKLGLPIHERDTFTKWDMPPAINLIIAVSFGKLVPSRLLEAAKYGGLNVHPSLLPNLRGPAPLHHALLRQMDATGVSLQTLDPHEFDKGLVLAQSRGDDELIRIPPRCTVPQLLELVTPVGARMLVQGLRDGVHVPPLEEQQQSSGVAKKDQDQGQGQGTTIFHAPKIGPEDRDLHKNFLFLNKEGYAAFPMKSVAGQLMWPSHLQHVGPVDSIALAQRVIGPLWFLAVQSRDDVVKRVIIDKSDNDIVIKYLPDDRPREIPNSPAMECEAAFIFPLGTESGEVSRTSPSLLWYLVEEGDDSIYLFDGPFSKEPIRNRQVRCLRITRLKVDGQAAKPARQVLGTSGDSSICHSSWVWRSKD